MKKDVCRVIKIDKDALYEFIYENFVANQEEMMDVESTEVMNTFAIDWERGEFIFCAHQCEDEHGTIIPFPKDIDIHEMLEKIPNTTSTALCDKPYRDYTFDELRNITKEKKRRQSSMEQIKWAVLGTGVIANEMAQALEKSGKKIYAVGNRTYSKGVEFAEKYGIEKVYDDFHEMFTDPEVDAIYITTPHNTHIQFMREALKNGKHLLVEKSITLNSEELEEAISLAKEHHVILAEAMTIYHMPIYKKLKEILASGRLGKVNLITMNFGSFKEYDMRNRFFNRNLAGGAMLDIGVYALSFVRWFMDETPNRIHSQVQMAPTGVDESATMLLSNEQGQMATVALSLHSKQPKRGMISCEKGYIEIMEYPRAWEAKITYTADGTTEVIAEGEHADALRYELEDMEAAIRGDNGRMYLEYTKDVMQIMTQVRREWKMYYPEEE